MEDRHVALFDVTPGLHVFGVFDGHGGDAAADYCTDNIPVHIKTSLAAGKDMDDTLTNAFHKVDVDFCKYAASHRMDDGTTAVVLCVKDGQLWCANAGDSRCILSRNSLNKPLSVDHKPNRTDERTRIEALGGFVKNLGVWRTQGVLAVSRAIGDASLKPYVIATPEITCNALDTLDQFAVLASD
jgi:protein phosphatase 1L